MANICEICGKRPNFGCNVSHARNRTRKISFPNIRTMRYKVPGRAAVKRGSICTKCVKSGKVEKVI